MIRYSIAPSELERQAEAKKRRWRARVDALTAKFDTAGRYLDSESTIWSEIKDVFIELQHGKCAFCERTLEGRKEYDVEHFRPKSSVKRWPVSAALTAAGVVVNQPVAATPKEAGYHLLAYHLLNYSVACAKCNSELKSDYFPIKGTRQSGSDDPVTLLAAEKPFLVFPVGDFDDDPEDVITFHGLSPQAKARKGSHPHHRALLTIAFFKLDDFNKRRELFRGRADVVQKMGLALLKVNDPSTSAATAAQCRKIIDYHQSDAAPHASCARSYARLWRQHPAKAEACWNEAIDILDKISPPRRKRG